MSELKFPPKFVRVCPEAGVTMAKILARNGKFLVKKELALVSEEICALLIKASISMLRFLCMYQTNCPRYLSKTY
jgi:hypothetical protein